MPRYEPENFPAAGCLLALDVSERRIGLAVTDPARSMALPLETLARSKWVADAEALYRVISERQVGGLVIGLPLNMDGTTGPAAQSRLTFARNLDQFLAEKRLVLPYVMVDESLTSHAARDLLSGRGDEKNAEDQIAASLLLEQFLKI